MRREWTRRWAIVWLSVILVSIGCEPALPDDLPSLLRSMDSNRETTAVAASNKVAKKFGQVGLLKALGDGGPSTKMTAARQLVRFPSGEVEHALVVALRTPNEPNVRIAVLWT
jgi:hypothetical protein